MSRPPAVVWVSTSTSTQGGVATYVRTMRATPLWSRWNIRHVATHRDGSRATRAVTFAAGVARLLVEIVLRRPALIHIHMSSRGSFVRKSLLTWMARAVRIPVVLNVHGGGFGDFHDASPRWFRRYIRATCEAAARLVALGPIWAERLAVIAPAARLLVVPNAVVPGVAVGDPAPGEPLTFLFLGRVSEDKGVLTLVEAWARMTQQLPPDCPVRLVIAGQGELTRMRQMASQYGVGDDLELTGWVGGDEVQGLIGRSQVFVLPSRFEGQPMAMLESMARGLCVVATPVGGVPDLVDDSCAVLVPVGDVEALARAMREVALDGESRTRRGAEGLRRVRERFDVEVTWRVLDDLYREVIG